MPRPLSFFCSPSYTMSHSLSAALSTVTLTYGDIELVVAEDTLNRNTAPFTATNPSDDLNGVTDATLLDAFKVQFATLAEHPKSIPLQRAYATLIMFYRISKGSVGDLTCQRAKDELMGENAADTLLFIVAKLLRHDDTELRRYLQQPYILPSSLMECKQGFILGGENNIVHLFQQAREKCTAESKDRLTMKEFTTLYQQLDAQATSPSKASTSESKEEEKEDGDDKPRRTRSTNPSTSSSSSSASTSTSSSSSSSSPPSSSSKPLTYRSSSSYRVKRRGGSGCSICEKNDRQSEILLCDRVGCTTECHYYCLDPPLSAIPTGSWFCAECKPLVKQALMEERSLVVGGENEEKKKAPPERKDDDDGNVMEITVEEWRQQREQWQRDREQYEMELAAKDAEVEHLRAEVERFKRQRVEREKQPMEEERKGSPAEEEQIPAPAAQSPAREEQKEALSDERDNPSSTTQKRRGHGR